MNNLVQLALPGGAEQYADYWPRTTYEQLLYRLWENVPSDSGPVAYAYAIKPDIEGSACSVIVRRRGDDTVVMFNACDNAQDNNDLKAWFILNDSKLRRLLPLPGRMTLVGKMGHKEGERTFLIHYVIFNDEVFLDEVSIRKLLELGEFGSAIYAVPCTEVVQLTLNRTTGGVSFPFMNNVSEGLTLVGLPVNVIIERENGGAPVYKASLVHMKFLSFTHVTAPRQLTMEPAA